MAHFFITGCQRSGTTLLNLMLESHQDIHCFDESLSYNILAKRMSAPNTGNKLVGYKIPIWAEQLLESVLDGNELALVTDIDQVPNFYGRENVIFIVRNPIDTVSSMLNLTLGGDSWLELVAVPVIQRKLSNPYFASDFSSEIESAMSSPDRSVALGALYWKLKTSALLMYRKAGLPVHTVFYEALVEDPRSVMSGVLDFLGVSWDESVLNHHTLSHSQIIDGKAIGNTDPSRPIDTHSIGRWKEVLTEPQIEIIRRITTPLEEKLYADTDS